MFFFSGLDELPVDASGVRRSTDPVLSRVLEYTLSGRPKGIKTIPHAEKGVYSRTSMCLVGNACHHSVSTRNRLLQELHEELPSIARSSNTERSIKETC